MTRRSAHNKRKNRPQRAKSRHFRDFLPDDVMSACPHPEKRKFHTKESAEDFVNKLHSRSTVRYGTHYLPARSYQCACQFWHITSKELLLTEEVIASDVPESFDGAE